MQVSLETYSSEIGAPCQEVSVRSDTEPLRLWHRLTKYFRHGSLWIARLPEIVFFPDTGVTLTPDGRILQSITLPVHEANAETKLAAYRARAAAAREMPIPAGTALVGGSRNYYHWFISFCLKVLALERGSLGDQAEAVLFCNASARFQWETVRASGYLAERDAVFIAQPGPVRLRDVLVSTTFGNGIHVLDQLDWVRRLPKPVASPVGRRVYVDRRDSPANVRQISNASEVEAMLERYGFEPVVLSELSLDAQAAVFREANWLVSPHGAGLTNLVHCARRPAVVEISSEASFSHTYHSIGKATGVRKYEILVCEDLPGPRGNKKNIHVDLGRLETKLHEIGLS